MDLLATKYTQIVSWCKRYASVYGAPSVRMLLKLPIQVRMDFGEVMKAFSCASCLKLFVCCVLKTLLVCVEFLN